MHVRCCATWLVSDIFILFRINCSMRYFEQAAVFTEACLEYRLIKINQENSILPPLPFPLLSLPSPSLSLPLPSPPLPFPLLSSLPSPSPPPFLPLQSSSLFPSLIVHSCSGGDGVLGLCPLSSQFGPHQRHEALLWKGGEERGRAARTSSLCRPQEEPPTVLTKRWRACYIVQVMKLFTFYRGARHGTPEFWESLLARTASTSAWQGHVHPSIHRLRNLCHVKKNH